MTTDKPIDEQANALMKAFRKVIDKYRGDGGVTYATVIGCLEIAKQELMREAFDAEEG